MDFNYYIWIFALIALTEGGSIGMLFEDDYEDTPFTDYRVTRCPYIRNKLRNGRVKIRSKGRIAKFLCDSGYELAGKRFATCVRGQWNNPIPVCVARGCNRLRAPTNGRVTEMYRGALLTFVCNPGYTLYGPDSIHCDGRRWNAQPPNCNVADHEPAFSCDFEDRDLCGWSQDPTHDFDWKRNQFNTPSGLVGTGPSFDHTFGSQKGGFYLYLEASTPQKDNDKTRLFSPVYAAENSGGCFSFWYHMYGSTMGALKVYLKSESHVLGELSPAWEKNGDQGNQWLRGTINVPALDENFQIVIEGVRGTGYAGDAAIDDVSLSKSDCESIENDTEVTASTSSYSCRGRCREASEEESCGCEDSCYANGNCCSDYLSICFGGNETVVENPDERPAGEDDYGKTSSFVTMTATNSPTQQANTSEGLVLHSEHDETSTTVKNDTESSATTNPFTTQLPEREATETHPEKFTHGTLPTPTHYAELYKTSSETENTTVPIFTTVSTDRNSLSAASSSSTTTSVSVSSTMSTTLTQREGEDFSSRPTVLSSVSTSTPTAPITPPSTLATAPGTVFISSSEPSSTSTSLSSTSLRTTYSSTSSHLNTNRTASLTPIVFYSTSAKTPSSDTSSTSAVSTTAKISDTTVDDSPSAVTYSSISTLSTRKTYNLRPRTRATTLSVSTTGRTSTSRATPYPGYTPRLRTLSTEYSSTRSSTPTNSRGLASTTKSYYELSTQRNYTVTRGRVRDYYPTTEPTTVRNDHRFKYTTESTQFREKESINYTTSAPVSNKSLSKSASKVSSNSPTIIIISVTIVCIVCAAGGLFYYFKKQKNKRQSKLSDDSELRFLSASEEMEYSDPSSLDKILVK